MFYFNFLPTSYYLSEILLCISLLTLFGASKYYFICHPIPFQGLTKHEIAIIYSWNTCMSVHKDTIIIFPLLWLLINRARAFFTLLQDCYLKTDLCKCILIWMYNSLFNLWYSGLFSPIPLCIVSYNHSILLYQAFELQLVKYNNVCGIQVTCFCIQN